jgi:hypothetical protein
MVLPCNGNWLDYHRRPLGYSRKGYFKMNIFNYTTNVYMNKKLVGVIKQNQYGFFYQPKNSTLVGKTFATLDEVKKSLESA